MTLAEIDRAFFELMRLALVELGHLPDVTQYASPDEYIQAKNAIIANNKRLVEVYGVGSDDTRDTQDYDRIVIDRGALTRGSIGAAHVKFYNRKAGGWYDKAEMPSEVSRDLNYEIRAITNSTYMQRLLEELMIEVLGDKRRLNTVTPEGTFKSDVVLSLFEGSNKLIAKKGKFENIYRYRVPDVWIGKDKIVQKDIHPLTTIKYSVYLSSDKEIVTTNEIKHHGN